MTLTSTFSNTLKSGLSLALFALFPAQIAQADEAKQIVSIGGAVTEIVYALNQENRLVARDTTSNFPASVVDLPNVGYARALSPEGVLSVGPDLILAIEGAGPPETLEVLKQANVDYVEVPEVYSAEGVISKIEIVGKALGQEDAAARLIETVSADLVAAQALANKVAGDSPKRVLFILSTTGGRITAAGQDTGADGIITMAGAVNAITEFSNYKQMSDEAIAAAAPDVILAMDRGGDHGLTLETLQTLPALKLTPAAQNGQLIRMDGALLLQFGPRAASAVKDLSQALYGATE
ncbi:ABC transporter substrate-binding protein [Pseudophaeobacter sp.]|uniref:heme/hemin ABC transporter substrate-binding protein n=1 Tax=Pseudophaeobacter sp. TaxID=1971739 RepID=UPI003298E18E